MHTTGECDLLEACARRLLALEGLPAAVLLDQAGPARLYSSWTPVRRECGSKRKWSSPTVDQPAWPAHAGAAWPGPTSIAAPPALSLQPGVSLDAPAVVECSESSAGLARLQRDIDARMERNRRLAEGGAPMDAALHTDTAASPTAGTPPSEIDRERELTAFMERTVMSC